MAVRTWKIYHITKKKIGGRENFDMALFRLFMGQIDDHWRTALLSTGAINNEGHYPSRELKCEKDILKEYGGLRDL